MDENQFLVMVDRHVERARLVDSLHSVFPDAQRRKDNSLHLRGNWLEVWPNDDADENLAADPTTGYLHFRWRVEVTPLDASVTEDDQVQLARDLLTHLRSDGAAAEVCANFEDRL
ncbi:hypothetical protein AB0M02_35715 [Actinoplanes sp. NPDC051861]|uniref:hypothetical protein n=1 Tax=Actinoplanes sp. NPDC051861 TaxID=3155170 RepID=UPI0034435E38